ncbi:glyoxalase domain-containing protein 5-like isoform X1 [Littorina saxatilis]|uniref:Glyoxalase domain-containing protein 5 n=2 Tax=Littorina saxatilis TaxID=31220 RepID=A0AAN9G9P2_9CAEN
MNFKTLFLFVAFLRMSQGQLKPIKINRLDHFVITVKDLDTTVDFYTRVLGMKVNTFAGGRKSLHFGRQKINIHVQGSEFEPKAIWPTPGSTDVCFITPTQLDDVVAHLNECEVEILEGPVARTGATGPINSVYFRDPDHNLIEVANYEAEVEPSSSSESSEENRSQW